MEYSSFLHPELETMPVDELRQLQLNRLKETVRHCMNSPFYQEKFASLGREVGRSDGAGSQTTAYNAYGEVTTEKFPLSVKMAQSFFLALFSRERTVPSSSPRASASSS